jgi:thymidylate synthase
MSNFSNQFTGIINKINDSGSESQPRNLKVRELIYGQFDVDSTQPFASFKDRAFNWKYFAGEVAWYLKKDNDIDYINKFSNFWKGITNPNSNTINSNYGSLLFGPQLKWCLDSLKADDNTRQAIAFLNQPKFQFEGNKDFVCTMYLNFFIRDNKLNMKVQMRSNDIFYGLTFDAPFFAVVHQHMLLWLKETYPTLELGTYTHFADNIHYYERHFELSEQILTNGLSDNQYTMNIEQPLFTLEDNGIKYTEAGLSFISEVDAMSENENAKGKNYLEILSKYLNVKNASTVNQDNTEQSAS